MNLLLDILPNEVIIGDVEYSINTDFRCMILFEQIMQSNELTDYEKANYAINNFYPDSQPPSKEAVEFLLWFYRRGLEPEKPIESDDGDFITKREPKVFSWEHDAPYIYAAFLDQYGIDLNLDELHWWKFKALFDGLKDDHMLSKIVGYRSMNITSDMTSRQVKFYRDQKKRYALPDERTEEERERDFADALDDLF